MIRPSAHHVTTLLMLAVAACYDRPDAALSSDKAVTKAATPDSSRHATSPGVTAVTADAATKNKAKPEPAPPGRNHRDTAAVACMPKPDSVLDRKSPLKLPKPLPGAIFP